MNIKTRELIIIGSGPAGLTAGIYTGRANLSPLIFEGDKPGGQLMGTSYVENWPGDKKILGPDLMKNILDHAEHAGSEFKSRKIIKVDFSSKPFRLWDNKEEEYACHACIIATGARPKKLNIPGEEKYWGKGVTTCAVCDAAFYKDRKAFVIGGGDTATEDALFLTKFTDEVTIVQNQDELTASTPMKKRILDNPKIDIIFKSTATEILGDDSRVTGIKITNLETKKEQEFKADGIFLAIGMQPNSKPFEGQVELDKWGYIRLTDHTTTSVMGVFAAGDIADPVYRQAITSSGSGCMAALDAEKFLSQMKLPATS